MVQPTPRALIADDDRLIRILVARALSKERIVCDQAEDGHTAAAKIEATKYDIVIADLLMPNCDGHALCRTLLERPDRPLVVVITGLNEPRLTRDLTARGVDAIYQKPLDFTVFGRQIRTLWEKHREIPPELRLAEDQGEPSCAAPPTKPRCAAIFLRSRPRALQLAAELRSDVVDVVVPETSDALCSLVENQDIDVILIEDGSFGFLTGAEILARIQNLGTVTQAVVIGDPDKLQSNEMQSLNIRRVFDPSTKNADLAHSLRSVLTECERGAGIPAEARRLVRHHGSPAQSPAVLLKLSEYASMAPGEFSIEQLAKDIMADSATTIELLRLANGSSLGVRRQITEISDAISLLGPGRSVMLLIAAGSRNLQRGLMPKIPPDLCAWYELRTVLIASVASVFAERYTDLSPDTAFVLGLIQEIGILVLANAFGDRYLRLIERARSVGPARLHAIEQQYFRVHHGDVSAALVERWRLPERLVQPILHHHDSRSAPREALAFLNPMRVGEAFADLWDNRHPSRKDAMSKLLAECRRDGAPDFNDSLAAAVAKATEVAQLYLLPRPDEAIAQSVCTAIAASCEPCPAPADHE